MNTISNSIFVTAIIFIQILITGCQVKELSPFEKAKNPYGHLGVEGYMGSAMTTCLGASYSGAPVGRAKKSDGVVVNEQFGSEKESYFDCVDDQVQQVERNILDAKGE